MDIKQEAFNQISLLKESLDSYGYSTSEIEQKNYNYEFYVLIGEKKFKVQVYFGKKGVKKVIQGDTSLKEYEKLNEIISGQMKLDYFEQVNEPEEYIGTDECGKGDLFGPLVVAAVYVNDNIKKKLKELNVRDSKSLSEKQIFSLSKKIIDIIGNNYSIVTILPKRYNKLYSKFKNLNTLLNWAHSKAIENLLLKVKCSIVITDKFSNKELDISNNKNFSPIKFLQVTKGEKFIGVAAASILARNKFNEWFNNQLKNGINLKKGSSKLSENSAIDLIKKVGKENLCAYAKLHFKSIIRLKEKMN
ncbi:MAG: ribonuclease HIII [Melioribacter sp.]|nr:ribonuclease HIII [Melioribacter sp.]